MKLDEFDFETDSRHNTMLFRQIYWDSTWSRSHAALIRVILIPDGVINVADFLAWYHWYDVIASTDVTVAIRFQKSNILFPNTCDIIHARLFSREAKFSTNRNNVCRNGYSHPPILIAVETFPPVQGTLLFDGTSATGRKPWFRQNIFSHEHDNAWYWIISLLSPEISAHWIDEAGESRFTSGDHHDVNTVVSFQQKLGS